MNYFNSHHVFRVNDNMDITLNPNACPPLQSVAATAVMAQPQYQSPMVAVAVVAPMHTEEERPAPPSYAAAAATGTNHDRTAEVGYLILYIYPYIRKNNESMLLLTILLFWYAVCRWFQTSPWISDNCHGPQRHSGASHTSRRCGRGKRYYLLVLMQ
jgi:hypothetical protein